MKKMKVKNIFNGFTFVTMIVFLLLTFSLVQAQAPTAQNPKVLKLSLYISPSHFALDPKVGVLTKWIEAVEKETGGRIKFKIYYSQALGKTKDHFDMVRMGVADVVNIVTAYTPAYFPLMTIASLPGSAPGKSLDVVAKALWELHKRGLLDKKFKEVKVLNLDSTMRNVLFLHNKKITSMADFKNLKVETTGEGIKIVSALGATPVPLPITDAYMALQKGMIDALVHNWAAAPAYKTYEVTRYVLEGVDFGCSPLALLMNLDTWNSLPPDIQKSIDNVDERFVGQIVYGSADKKSMIGYELYGEEKGVPEFTKRGVKEFSCLPRNWKKARRRCFHYGMLG